MLQKKFTKDCYNDGNINNKIKAWITFTVPNKFCKYFSSFKSGIIVIIKKKKQQLQSVQVRISLDIALTFAHLQPYLRLICLKKKKKKEKKKKSSAFCFKTL